MTTTDWLIAGVRVLIIISMISGARRAWQSRKEAGAGATMAGTVATTIVLLLYLVGAVLLFTWYGVFAYPRQIVLFAIGAVAYLWGGLWLVGKTAALFEKRAMRQRGEL